MHCSHFIIIKLNEINLKSYSISTAVGKAEQDCFIKMQTHFHYSKQLTTCLRKRLTTTF